MADILLDSESAPTTPSAGQVNLFVDTTTKRLSTKNDAGVVSGVALRNASTVAQLPAATTRTYLAGSALSVPTNKLQVGSTFRWRFTATKTAAGVAASTIDVAVGTAGTTADTARVSFAKPAGTAVVDEAYFEITLVVRSIGAAGVMVGQMLMTHNLQITGHAIIPNIVVTTVSGAFDMTVANLILGLCITTGAADAVTIEMVTAEAENL